MQVVKIDQRSDAWHRFRANGIGGSEVSAILGLSPYMTRYQLFLQKTGRVPPPDLSRNPHVVRGMENEDRIAEIISHHFGEKGEAICGIHDDFPFIRCSFDYVTAVAINEIKAPSDKQWEWVLANGPHPYYVVQAEYQSIVGETLGLETRLIYWRRYGGKDEVLVFPVVLTPKRRDEIITSVSDFWKLLQSDTPPDLDPERDRIQIDTEEWATTASLWKEKAAEVKRLNDLLKKAKEAMGEQENEFARLAGDFPLAEGSGVKYTKFFKRGAIDYKALIAEQLPELQESEMETYRKPGTFEVKVSQEKAKKA